jgi:ribose transport system permease protein
MDQAHIQKQVSHRISHIFSAIFRRNDISVVIATLSLFIIFTLSSPSFLTPFNLFNVSRTASLYVLIALAQAIVIVVGGMNLSVGAIGALTVVISGHFLERFGWPPVPATIIGLMVGILAGAFNGGIIVKTKLNSFVVTLATSFVFAGLVNGISRGFPYTKIPKSITFIGTQDIFGIPYMFILMVIVLIVMWYVFKYTVTGRRLLATGGNIEAARLSGVRTGNMIFLANVLSGLFASLAAMVWISRMGSAQPNTGGDWLIISFAVSIIGGTALTGGDFSSIGVFAAAFLLTLIRNGLIMLNVNVYFEQTFLGIIILLAVSVESIRMMLSNSARKKTLRKELNDKKEAGLIS